MEACDLGALSGTCFVAEALYVRDEAPEGVLDGSQSARRLPECSVPVVSVPLLRGGVGAVRGGRRGCFFLCDECVPFVLIHGWYLWFPFFPLLLDFLRVGSAQCEAQLERVVPVRALRVPGEPVRSCPHLGCGSAGQSRAHEPVVDGRLWSAVPRVVCGLVVPNTYEAVVRA